MKRSVPRFLGLTGLLLVTAIATLGGRGGLRRPSTSPHVAAQGTLQEAYALVDTWDGSAAQGAPGSLLNPGGIAVDGDTVFIVDRGNDRIQVFSPQGAFLRAWGQNGSGPSDLSAPQDVAVDGDRVYVTDRGNDRIAVFDRQGAPVATWTATGLSAPWAVAARGGRVYVTYPESGKVGVFQNGSVIAQWSGLAEPRGIAVGPDGRVYVADYRAGVVRFFGADGSTAGELRPNLAPLDIAVDSASDLWVMHEVLGQPVEGTILWYQAGSSNSRLAMYHTGFQGISVSERYGIYATVASDARQWHGVYVYPWRAQEGVEKDKWQRLGYPPGRLNGPHAIHFGGDGRLWILDGWPRIQVFDANGQSIAQYLLPAQRVDEALPRRAVDAAVKSSGEFLVGEPRFLHRLGPRGTLSGTVRLADSSDQYWLTALSRPGDERHVLMLDSALMRVRDYWVTRTLQAGPSWPLVGTQSPNLWELYADIAGPLPNPSHRLYAVNRTTHRVEVYDNGRSVGTWAVDGIPIRADVGPQGHVFVLTSDGIVQKHTPDGQVVAAWDAAAFSAGGSAVADLAVDGRGRVYTVDREADTVRVWDVAPDVTPEPPQSRGGACRLRGDKRAAPESVRLGQAVTVQLEIGGECPNTASEADIILAIDRSYSMNADNKITATIQAALTFIDAVNLSRDRLGVVTFSNSGQLVQGLSDNRDAIRLAVQHIQAVGGTNIADAISVSATELFGSRGRPGALPVLVLLTDGKDREPDDVVQVADAAKARGMRIFTIGFGDVDPMVMVMSATSPEYHYYTPDTAKLTSIYAEIARRILATVLARTMTVTDRVPPNMRYVVDSAQPPATWDVASRTLTWELTNIPFAGGALTYQVEPLELGCHPTNVEALAEFVDGLDRAGRLRFPVPQVCVLTDPPTATPTRTPFPTPTPTPRPLEPVYLPILLKQKCEDLEIHTDVILVMDTSGSMRDPSREGGVTKIAAAIVAARAFVANLALPQDEAAIVSFNDTARLEQELTGDRDLLLAALDRLEARPNTRIDLGLDTALGELTGPRGRTGQSRAIVLLTDGRSTGIGNDVVLAVADRAKQERCTIFTVGLGTTADVDFDLLRQVASKPDYFYPAPSTDDLERIYSTIAYSIKCANLDWP